jgi:cyclic pyranopterin phosphate synthase
MDDILSYEEILKITRAAVANGVSKIRITGGEPLMRKNMVALCRMLSSLPEVTDLSVTTNGVLLDTMAADLKAAGVTRVNISLDTLNKQRYSEITGKDRLKEVLKGIETVAKAGFHPIKINMVPMRGMNDDEIAEMARWTLTAPYDIRFIELMPTSGWAQNQHTDLFISIDEIQKKVETIGRLEPIPHIKTRGPAAYARFSEGKGRIGFIAALSHCFCKTCNRLRLTADGKLRACLFAEEEVDIRSALRHGASTETLQKMIRRAAAAKPKGHTLNDLNAKPINGRMMRAIGG